MRTSCRTLGVYRTSSPGVDSWTTSKLDGHAPTDSTSSKMAYSMNWRPQLDEIEKTASTSAPPNLRPPVTKPVATSSSKAASNGVYSYNMNWRPPSPPALVLEEPSRVPVSNAHDSPSTTSGDTSFRASLAESCPPVHCFSNSAFSCSSRGLVVTLEEGPHHGLWDLRIHPNNAKLSVEQTLDLARAIHVCLYAAVCRNRLESIRLSQSEMPSASHKEAFSLLAIPRGHSETTVNASFLLQNFAFADRRFYRPPRPRSPDGDRPRQGTSRRRSRLPVETLYTRRCSAAGEDVVITASLDDTSEVEGEVTIGSFRLSFDSTRHYADEAAQGFDRGKRTTRCYSEFC